MQNILEIFIANGVGAGMMLFLLYTRSTNRENVFADDQVFDIMAWITIAGSILESVSFAVDGRMFPGARFISYLTNSLCYIGTVSVGFLWCIYEELHIFRNTRRVLQRLGFLSVPFVLDVILIFSNLLYPGLVFGISQDNTYSRGIFSILVYLFLFIYFIYALAVAQTTRWQGLRVQFFPVLFFVGPCMVGTLIQGCFYGVSLGWLCVAVAFMFVQIQSQSETLVMDSMSGLFNRRYIDVVLRKIQRMPGKELYGIFIDVNDFKRINDEYGHSKGDETIRVLGQVLNNSIPDGAVAIRYAGDEFIVLMLGLQQEIAALTMGQIEENLEKYNQSGAEPFQISVAMGCSHFDPTDKNGEQFFSEMDERMYEAKRRYYESRGVDRRKK